MLNDGGALGGGTGDRNTRNTISCGRLRNEQGMWFIGHQMTIPSFIQDENRRWMEAMQDWGAALHASGIVGEPAWRLLYPSAGNPYLNGNVPVGQAVGELVQVRQLENRDGRRGYVWFSNWRINNSGQLVRSPYSYSPDPPASTSNVAARAAEATATAAAAAAAAA